MTDLYERQAALEYECVVLGVNRYEKQRKGAGETSTRPGRVQTWLALPALTKAIEQFVTDSETKAGRSHAAAPYLTRLLPVQAAYLTIRYTLDAAAQGKALTATAIEVGNAIQNHINILDMAHDAPGLFRKVMEQLKVSTSARHRELVLRHVLLSQKAKNSPTREGRDWLTRVLTWRKDEKVRLGTKLIELLEASTNLVKVRVDTLNKHHSSARVYLTAEADEWFAAKHADEATYAPVHLPMLVPPRDWTSPFHGGYLTNAAHGSHMILSHSHGFLDEIRNVSMPDVYTAVNVAQATPWRINRGLLSVMQEAQSLGARFQALFIEPDDVLPARPPSVPPPPFPASALTVEQRELFVQWKREAADVYQNNARLKSKRAALNKALWVADRYADEVQFWFPHFLDFRGRMYPFASYLNPQADDFGRALLEFAEGKPLGERGMFWLKVHVANLFGVDKVSFADRVKWTTDNLDKLTSLAASPLDSLDFWLTADSPWMALAACMELTGSLIEGADYVSHLPIAMDGSCSGLQHYSAMLRDPIGGAAVNLVPAEKPGDIYSAVAQRAQAVVDGSHDAMSAAWKGGKVIRRVAKQPTMTICYSATVYGMQRQIEHTVKALGGNAYVNGVSKRDAAKYLAPVIWESIGDTVVAARDAMAFLKELAALAAEGDLPIRWTSPLGFPVVQAYREQKPTTVNCIYAGQRLQLDINRDGTRLDKRRQASGVAPNVVHSLDAAHLMSTIVLGAENDLFDWAAVHDSFGVHASDVDTLHAIIREVFIEQYTPNVLERLRDEVAAHLQTVDPDLLEKLPAVPLPGTLDLAAVRESAYFFA